MNDPLDDEYLEIEPRSVPEVADRLLLLATTARRLVLESSGVSIGQTVKGEESPDHELFDLRAWLDDNDQLSVATPEERAALETPVGALDPDLVAALSWRVESGAMLAWALSLLTDPPTWDQPAAVSDLLDVTPEPVAKIGQWQQSLTLRDLDDLAATREQAELWHWRLGLELMSRSRGKRERQEMRALARDTAAEALAAGLLPTLNDNDFPFEAGAVGGLSQATLEIAVERAAERLRAMNWLCGFGADWDQTPLSLDDETE